MDGKKIGKNIILVFISYNLIGLSVGIQIQMGNCQTSTDIVVPSNFQGVFIKCRSWKKTYSNLFDYASQPNQYLQKDLTVNLKIGQSSNLMKDGQEIKIVSEQKKSQQQNPLFTSLLRFTNKHPNYLVQPNLNLERLACNQVWLTIKSIPSGKYKLKQGDIIRIGNQKIKVKQIILQDNQVQTNLQIQAKFKIYENLMKENSAGYNPDPNIEQPICRVCLQQAQINNPLLSPCKCSGTAKFIHVKCIQQWFNKIIDPRKVNSSIVISWKPLVCELCAQPLPFKIYLDDVKHFTVNIPRPEKPYIVLNPIIKQKSSTRIYHLISLKQKKSLVVGRKKDADIVLDEDSSISRHHSLIQFQQKKEQKKGRVLISDQDSKFGTLVLLKKPINLSGNLSGVTLQFGGSIATLNYKKSEGKGDKQQQINEQNSSASTESIKENENQNQDQQPPTN